MGGESLSTGLTGLNREVRGGVGADLLACGIDINTNSDEDCHISSDVSSDESDYPLHNEALLSALYSLNNPHPASGEVNGLNHPKLSGVSVNLYEPDSHHLTSLQEERGEIGEKASKVAMVTEDQSSTAADKKPPKLSSKLSSLEQAVIATAVSGVSQESDDMFRKGVEPDKDSNASSSVASTHGQGDKAKPDSLATLSSYFVKGQGSLESAMVSAIGLEKLTQLGRVGSARITVGSLKIDPSFAQQVLTQRRETKRNGQAGSNIPLPSHSTKRYTALLLMKL